MGLAQLLEDTERARDALEESLAACRALEEPVDDVAGGVGGSPGRGLPRWNLVLGAVLGGYGFFANQQSGPFGPA